MEKYFTVREVSEMLGIAIRTVTSRCSKLGIARVGGDTRRGTWVITKDDIDLIANRPDGRRKDGTIQEEG